MGLLYCKLASLTLNFSLKINISLSTPTTYFTTVVHISQPEPATADSSKGHIHFSSFWITKYIYIYIYVYINMGTNILVK